MRFQGKPLSNHAISLSLYNNIAIPTSDRIYVTNLNTKVISVIRLELKIRDPSYGLVSVQNLAYERIKKCLYCDIYLLILTTYGRAILYNTALEHTVCTVNDLLEDIGQIKEIRVLESSKLDYIFIGNDTGKVAVLEFHIESQNLVSKISTSSIDKSFIYIATANCEGEARLWKYSIDLNQVKMEKILFEKDYKMCTAIEFTRAGRNHFIAIGKSNGVHVVQVGNTNQYSKLFSPCMTSGFVWAGNSNNQILRIYTVDSQLYTLAFDLKMFTMTSMANETSSLRSVLSSSVDVGLDDNSEAGSESGVEDFYVYGVVSSQHTLIDFVAFELVEPFSNISRTERVIAVHKAEYSFRTETPSIDYLIKDFDQETDTSPAKLLYDLYFSPDVVENLDINEIDRVVNVLFSMCKDDSVKQARYESLMQSICYYFLVATETKWEDTLMTDQYRAYISNTQQRLSSIFSTKVLNNFALEETVAWEDSDFLILSNLVAQSNSHSIEDIQKFIPKAKPSAITNGKTPEQCVICNEAIPFSIFDESQCPKQHYFARCSITKTTIDFPDNLNCSNCPAKLRKFEKTSTLKKTLPTVKCLYCQSPFINSKLEFI
ncbi:hypothetical protein HDV01_005954 [Terramyces sp. JEL0728]|nr:hypothetical protein HDV01_005954 [Terramyces sp. JEL0728]